MQKYLNINMLGENICSTYIEITLREVFQRTSIESIAHSGLEAYRRYFIVPTSIPNQ